MTAFTDDHESRPFSAALVPFPVQDNLPGLPAPREVRHLLGEQFTAAVHRERVQRGEVLKPTDTWPMVRAVQGFAELVDDYARALGEVSKDARKVLEEELFEAQGEQDGIPSAPLEVPHDGSIISVKAKTQNQYDIDSDQVISALVALVSNDWGGVPNGPSPTEAPEEFAVAVARRLLDMVGASTLKVTHVRALAVQLGQQGLDGLSSVVTDAIRKRRLYKGVAVERKAAS